MSKERPILFSDEMIRAILSGAKTQTRRVVKVQPPTPEYRLGWCVSSTCKREEGKCHWVHVIGNDCKDTSQPYFRCPYGSVGDRLWVREAWAPKGTTGKIYYRADGELGSINVERWKPSIHMPRTFSRITLEITDVRVERLQDISEEDATAEGAPLPTGKLGTYPAPWATAVPGPRNYCETFCALWDRINAKRAPWASNPWVWVLEFKKCEERHK